MKGHEDTASPAADSHGSNGPPPADPLEGDDGQARYLGAYRIESSLGQGGMGEVFLAWDERLRRHVAIKRVRTDKALTPGHRSRFRREARAVARLSHPAIVQIFDIVEDDGEDCIVMEYVEGTSLAELISQGRFDVWRALMLTREIADGLAEAHAKGLLHRDLKPENIRISTSNHARILDFGLARALWDDDEYQESVTSLTAEGAVVGTAHAMSPEQARGLELDHRSDLFSLGGLLYEMLTGRSPFRGGNLFETLRRINYEEPKPVAELAPDVPPGVIDLVERLMAKDPAQRPGNAEAVVAEIDRLLLGSGTMVAPAEVAASVQRTSEQELGQLLTASGLHPAALDGRTSVIRILVLTDLVSSTALVERLGDTQASDLSARLNRVTRDLLVAHNGLEIDKTDGFLTLFERPGDAVAYALAYHQTLAGLSEKEGVQLLARIGIHLGEVFLRRNTAADVRRGAKALEVEGIAKPTAARVMALALGGQTLLTRGVFDLARRASATGSSADPQLRWLAHGAYSFKGLEDPLEIFEVGAEGRAPLAQPPDGAKAKRVVAFSDEVTLGWRPAVGQTVPRRPSCVLEKRIGEGGFGEIWMARHKSGERRVFKFCFEGVQLRALKREVTLFRLLKDGLGHREDIARILDWDFDEAPYFLESEYTEGGNMVEWAEAAGGLGKIPLERRLELVAEVAEALDAAHSVGILHKDVKPENVLMTADRDGRPRTRLTDFGIGLVADRGKLPVSGIIQRPDFTEMISPAESSAGTVRYMAPELLEAKPATPQADIYSLGVLLYQIVVGDFSRALAPGWKRDVGDDLLREDIATFVDGSPERRPRRAREVADRLRRLEERRAQLRAELAAKEARREALRSQRRYRLVATFAALSVVVLAAVSHLAFQAINARQEADQRRREAEGLVDFMLTDLRDGLEHIGRLDLLGKVASEAQAYLESQTETPDSVEARRRLGLSLLNTADVLLNQGETVRATDGYRAAVALFENLAASLDDSADSADRLNLARSLAKLGRAYQQSGDDDEALATFRQSLDVSESIVADRPDDLEALFMTAEANYLSGQLLIRQGLLDKALATLQATDAKIAEWPSGARQHWRSRRIHLNTQIELGSVFAVRSELDAALGAYQRALSSADQLVAEDPTNANWRDARARCQTLIGNILGRQGKTRASINAYNKARDLYRELAAEDPTNVQMHVALCSLLMVTAEFQTTLGDLQDAMKNVDEALRILQPLIRRDPGNTHLRETMCALYLQMGNIASRQDDIGRSLELYHEAISILAELANRGSDGVYLQVLKAMILVRAAHSQRQLGNENLARRTWDEALQVLDALPAATRSEAGAAQRVWALLGLGRIAAAQEALQDVTGGTRLDVRFRTLLQENGLNIPD